MPSFTLLSGQHTSQSLISSETGYLGSGAFLAGFFANGNSIDVRIHGSVHSGSQVNGTNNTLVVGRTGIIDSVNSTTNSAAGLDVLEIGAGGVSRVSNAGQINGNVAGIYSFVEDLLGTIRLTNTGSITGEAAGVLVQGSGRTTITNGGTITGFESGVTSQVASFSSNAPATITNHGTISGADHGVFLTDGFDTIVNRGLIDGAVSTGAGGDFLDNVGGRIFGSVSMGTGTDRFDNRGGEVFEFLIDLGGGDDTFLPGAGAEAVLGGAGARDRVILSHGAGGVIDLTTDESTGLAAGDTYAGFEYVIGSRTGADTIIGNAAANALTGLGGRDVLSGAAGADTLTGGTGADRLAGGSGNDIFIYDAAIAFGDIITDFSASAAGNNDRFEFVAAALGGGLAAGTLASAQFRSGATNLAGDANDRFIFRTTDKTLWFDANGNAAGGPVLVADLQQTATMTAADIVLV